MRTPALRRASPRLASSSIVVLTALLAGCTGQDTEALTLDDPPRAPLVRPDTPGNGLMFNFDPADVVETYGSAGGRFLVHFTRDGKNAVPAADVNADTVPDFVEEVASVYEEVLTKYHDELGFRAPVSDAGIADNGGDDRFDVYLVDFAGQGDGNYRDDACDNQDPQICAGYMVQENDFKGYGYPSTLIANRILGSHEFFHAVQSAYDNGQGSVIAEGTAVWATETFDASLKDFEGFLPGYLDNPDRPLDKPLPGAVDPFSYGAGLYFEFLSEHYGVDTVRSLWERCENGANGVADPYWLTELDPLLAAQANTTFASAMVDFATWNLFTKQYADPTRAYAASGGYPLVKMEDVTAPHFDDGLRVFYASAQYFRLNPDGRAEMTAALVAPAAAPDETSDLRMLLATRAGNTYAPVKEVVDPTAGTETIDTASADKLVVVVVNTTTGGNSRKPALCIGTTDEVAACRAAFLGGGGTGGAGGTGGSGGAGGSGGTTGGSGGGGGGAGSGDAGGCGCRTAGSSSPEERGTLAVALAFALALHRRRRSPSR